MVDRASRDRLAEMVRHLAAGQMSANGFGADAGFIAESTSDNGVGAVYAFANGLHPEAAELYLWPVRLRGRFRLAPEMRRRMAVAALFLYSDAEYEWPASPGQRGACLDGLLAFICGTLICVGLMLLPLALLGAAFVFTGRMSLALAILSWSGVFGCVGGFVAAFHIYRLSQRLAAVNYARWEEQQRRLGDYDVWPFLRVKDFEEAKRRPRLLCGFDSSSA